jgi:electron transport complex protein RnfD
MQDVFLALIPAGIFGVYNFGINALTVIVVTIAACVLTEYVYCKFMKMPNTIGDYSAVITGLLLAYNLPAGFPLWMAIIGGVFAILVVKMLFGGLGQNFMNPALAARVFLLISFPVRMTAFAVEKITTPGAIDYLKNGYVALDGVSGATPLALMKAGESVDLVKMLIGNIGGTIGETSAIAILIGAAYLVFKKIISLRIPISYIISMAIFVLIFGGKGFDMTFVLGHILGGGLLLGAFFMATDYVTSPITRNGQIVFGICLGLLTGLFRLMGGSAEGVSYAIIFCNLIVPLIEKLTGQKSFGKERAVREK